MAKKSSVSRKRAPLTQRKLAHAVLERADLKSVRLVSCDFQHNFSSPHQIRNVQLDVSGNSTADLPNNLLNVMAAFSITIKTSDNDTETGTFKFTFSLMYALSSSDGLTPENFDAFTRWIGLNNAWPYAREFLQSMTMRMALPVLKLPLFKPEREDAGLVVHE